VECTCSPFQPAFAKREAKESPASPACIIKNHEDLRNILRDGERLMGTLSDRKILVISQTTGNRTLFEETLQKVKER
jgi:hypothetical protein